MREPLVVHFRDAVAAGKDDVDKKLTLSTAERLPEPVRKRELGDDPVFGEDGGHFFPVGAPDKEIEVFRIPADPRVVNERIRPADKEVDVFPVKDLNDPLVKLGRVDAGGLNGRWCHTYRQARGMP